MVVSVLGRGGFLRLGEVCTCVHSHAAEGVAVRPVLVELEADFENLARRTGG